MASVRREVVIEVSPEPLWAAVRDVGALHTRLVVGFVADCRLEGDARVVTFANGMVARELIVDLNDADRRLVWTADFLPNELAPAIQAMIEQGILAMKKTFEAASNDA